MQTPLRNNEMNLQRTKRGRVICKSTEIYCRNDIGCGALSCNECNYLQPLKPTLSKNIYLIPDLLTIKHQIDIITSPLFLSKFNVILLQTILDNIKQTNYSFYKRIESELIECNKYNASIYIFMNKFNKHTNIQREKTELLIDFQFKQIVKVYKWYNGHLSFKKNKFLFVITESAKNVKLLQLFNVNAMQINLFIKTLFPANLCNLQDSLSCIIDADDSKNNNTDSNLLYKPHWKINRVEMELKNNKKIFKGKYYSIRAYGNNAYGKVLTHNSETSEIFVYGLNNINRAIHEDIVILKLLDKDKGEIVSIMEKNWRSYCGSLDPDTTSSQTICLFIPIDCRIPKIRIKTSQIDNLMDKRIIVNIDEWKINSKYPFGHYTETIGVIGDLETETQVLLLEHDIPYSPWSDSVLKCLPKPSEQDSDGNVNISNLRDLNVRRNLMTEGYDNIFSVDPPGCVDIDDALHCKELVNGNIEIGVHIADVSYYIPSNCALDCEAAKRGTSVYLIDRRIDMLPSLLSTDLCSLKPNKIRLSFSVFWEISIDKVKKNKINIVKTTFNRCIIKSMAALSYQQAQNIINDQNNKSQMAKSLRNLLFIAKILKKDRNENGALSLSSLQPKFKLSGDGNNKKTPSSLSAYKLYDTNSMIEEFMLLANISVAKKILVAFPSFAMLRRHPSPTKQMLAPLIKYASIKGFKINAESSKTLSKSLDLCVDKSDKSLNELIRIITTRCMTQAIYFISGTYKNQTDFKHYGLASSIYTHFTSPIRRYADIIVHRQLAYCCGYNESIINIKNITLMNNIVNSINRRHRLAQYINRASANLYTLIYFDNITNINKPIVCNAIISGIDANCLNVFIAKYCMERRIYLNNKQEWNFDSKKLILYKVTPPCIKYQIFDKVMAKIYVYTSKYHRKKLIVEIIDKNQKKNTINLNQQHDVDIVTSTQIM